MRPARFERTTSASAGLTDRNAHERRMMREAAFLHGFRVFPWATVHSSTGPIRDVWGMNGARRRGRGSKSAALPPPAHPTTCWLDTTLAAS